MAMQQIVAAFGPIGCAERQRAAKSGSQEAKAQIAELAARQEASSESRRCRRMRCCRCSRCRYVQAGRHRPSAAQASWAAADRGSPSMNEPMRLLIAGDDKQMSVAEQLVQTLDQPGESQQPKGGRNAASAYGVASRRTLRHRG